MPQLRWTGRDWLALFLLLLLVLLFHWRLITPNLADRQSYLPGDFPYQFWAFSTFEAREIAAGRLPLWNPYTFAGAPFWADVQSAVFYPFSLLTIFASNIIGSGFSLFALELEAMFHFWLAGLFTYFFVRRITQSRPAGFLSALVFTFGGYLAGYPSQQLAVLEVDVWLPFILFFVDRGLVRRWENGTVEGQRRYLDLTIAGVGWGCAILAGHPQSWLLVGYTVLAYFVYLTFRQFRRQAGSIVNVRGWLTQFTPVLLVFGVGLGLAAVQWLPAFEYTRLSVRAAGTYPAMSGGFFLTDPVQILLPGVVSYYSPLYFSLVGLLLVVLVLRNRPHGFVGFWLIWAAIAFLIAFGGETFLYSPLYLFGPGFSIFRGQERWAFVLAFSLAVVAGYGVQIMATHNHWRQQILPTVQGIWLAAIGLMVLFFYGLNDQGWSTENQFYQWLNAAVLLFVIASLLQIIVRVASKLSFNSIFIALGVLIIFDLFSVNWSLNLHPQLPAWHTQQPAVVTALKTDAAQSQAPFRVYNEFRLYDNYGIPFELEDMWGASPLRLSTYDRFVKPPMLIERAWAMLNVQYVISWREELYAPSTILYQEPASDGMTYLHRLAEVGPRAWLVHKVEQMPEAAMVARMAEPDFDPFQMALLPPQHQFELGVESTGNSVEAIEINPNQLQLQVKAASPGLLILSEIDYPGWQATINDQPAPIWRANGALRSIWLPAGSHQVMVTFQPTSFWLGLTVSGLTLLALTIYWLYGWRYRAREN